MLDRPWMTAIEMQYRALTNTKTIVATAIADDRVSSYIDRQTLQLLPLSIPFAWSHDTATAVWLASKTIPDTAMLTESAIPDGLRTVWWWLDSPLPIPMAHGKIIPGVNTTAISGFILHRHSNPDMLEILEARDTDRGPSITGFSIFPFQRTLGEILEGQRLNPVDGQPMVPPQSLSPRAVAILRFILAANIWLNQRILVWGSGAIERHHRKQLGRAHNIPPPIDVKVIQLRRIQSGAPGVNSHHDLIDWSCRWIVNGHWRNQIYAHGQHRLIYIWPFVKGPADKPLRVPAHQVYAVTR